MIKIFLNSISFVKQEHHFKCHQSVASISLQFLEVPFHRLLKSLIQVPFVLGSSTSYQPSKYMAEMPAQKGMGCTPQLTFSPVFIVYLKEGRSVLVYIRKKEVGESIHHLDTFSSSSVGIKQIQTIVDKLNVKFIK